MADEDEEDLAGSLGFMFDAAHARAMSVIDLGVMGVEPLRLRLIKGDPGHVQSGQYLWPAAQYAAKWLLLQGPSPRVVVELGAGCGLAGLATAQLESVKTVVLTDYDYGSLELLAENAADVLAQPYAAAGNKTVIVEQLKWGGRGGGASAAVGQAIALPVALVKAATASGKLLILGTDLIYSRDVVAPLLQTATALLNLAEAEDKEGAGAEFLLFGSFCIQDYDDEVTKVCSELGLAKTELETLDSERQKGETAWLLRFSIP
jgi:predicted nicotinamide N-methyase